MKKYIPSIAPMAVYLGLPASFIAMALHQTTPEVTTISKLPTNQGNLLPSAIFICAVMNLALIIVHHLRENHRLATFNRVYLRQSPTDSPVSHLALKVHLATV